MKTVRVTFILILALSLVFSASINRRKRNSDNALEDLLDYVLEMKRQGLVYNQRRKLDNPFQRRGKQFLDDADDYEKTYARRKAVGLGDNPY